MVEIGAGTLIGIAVTIFLSILATGVSFLYRISTNLNKIENNIQRMNENLGNKLDNIEENTRESSRKLTRIAERTRGQDSNLSDQGDDPGNPGGDTGNPEDDTGNPGDDAEIIESNLSGNREPTPDTDHLDEDNGSTSNTDDNNVNTDYEYMAGVLERLDELEGMEARSASETPDEIIEATAETVETESEEETHWVSEEAEDMTFALSKMIGENELYITVSVGKEVCQVNFHVAQAGFPGLVGTDPIQNKLTEKISNLSQEMYGENAVLSVHSGQIVVSLPVTDLNEVKEWIESTTAEIEDVMLDAESANGPEYKSEGN